MIQHSKFARRINVIGCPVDAISLTEVIDRIQQSVVIGDQLQIVPCNVDMVMKARRSPTFAGYLRDAGLVIADGVPVVWAASLLRTPLHGRVSGTDLVWECARLSASSSMKIALIGGFGDAAKRAGIRLRQRFPGADLVAFPTSHPLDIANPALADEIRKHGAQVVLAALGAPRQEEWIHRHLERAGANVGIGIGSAFDIISGDKPQAPQWMRDRGLERVNRLAREPRRLGRRYLIEDSPFIYHVARAALSTRWRKT